MGWNDLAYRERQRNLVAKTLKWRVLGGTQDMDRWFVGTDCGSCGVGGTRVGGGNEQKFGLRGSADDERGKDEEGRGARISTPSVSREHKFAWREQGLGAAPSVLVVGKISLRARRFGVCRGRW
jgi:hypothetical protein